MSAVGTPTVTLSPGFSRARKLSRVMAVVFSIGFWMMLLASVACLSIPFTPWLVPHGPVSVGFQGITVSLNGRSTGQLLWVLVAMEILILPLVFLMHHTRRVFGNFAKGEIFALPVIGHIRHAGLWLIVSFVANIVSQTVLGATGLMPAGQAQGSTWPLVIGVVTYIAAYVMEEARRIAADHAEIV
ncbi:MAG TPA: hypothetical protein VKB67_06965 [Rhizomicrobium sp.]|nr:hypothetical protein [Rhizomicrobium sp.]